MCNERGEWCPEEEYEVRGLLVSGETVLGGPALGRRAQMIQVQYCVCVGTHSVCMCIIEMSGTVQWIGDTFKGRITSTLQR